MTRRDMTNLNIRIQIETDQQLYNLHLDLLITLTSTALTLKPNLAYSDPPPCPIIPEMRAHNSTLPECVPCYR
jgi:hypothetical protein